MQKIKSSETGQEGLVSESPPLILSYMLVYIRNRSEEGDVEKYVAYARKYLSASDLTLNKRIVIGGELRILLLDGYESEAWRNLEEIKTLYKFTDVSKMVAEIRECLSKAGIEIEPWLEEYDSSLEELKRMEAEGIKNREKNLRIARSKKACAENPN